MRFQTVQVPDVLGLPFALAWRLGDDAGLRVTGLGPDGQELTADTDSGVVAQDPAPLARVRRGARLVLRVGGGGGSAGDHEPRLPLPPEQPERPDLGDKDSDSELAGAPV